MVNRVRADGLKPGDMVRVGSYAGCVTNKHRHRITCKWSKDKGASPTRVSFGIVIRGGEHKRFLVSAHDLIELQ